jgi:hypothetical protein
MHSTKEGIMTLPTHFHGFRILSHDTEVLSAARRLMGLGKPSRCEYTKEDQESDRLVVQSALGRVLFEDGLISEALAQQMGCHLGRESIDQ